MSSEADRVIKFIETFLTLGHSFIGEPFILQPFQKDIIYDMYAEGETPGKRLRRTYVLGLPRKNGKSQLGAALAIYHLVGDKYDNAPQVYSAAGDRAQARLVFDEAKRMIEASPDLSEICKTYRTEIRCTTNGGVYKALSSDAGLQQGLNPSFVVFDELHIFKNAALYEALTLGAAARKSPLTMVISTAGYDLESPLGKLYQIGRLTAGHFLNGVRQAGEKVNSSFGMTWWGPTQEDMQADTWDHEDPLAWRRYNPFWSIMSDPMAEFDAALMQTHESAFVRFKLNGWTTSAQAFLPAGSWAALEDPELKIADREEVILGFDGAWKGDSTALVAVSLETFHMEVLGHWEAPPNDPDWRTPADVVEAEVIAATKKYNVKEMVADPYRFEQSLHRLQEEHKVPLLEFPTNVTGRMIPATGSFYQGVMDQEFTHDGNPALARHLANAVLRDTPTGAYITKQYKSSRNHIDLAVAAIIAVERARMWRKEAPASDDSLLLRF
jgi:phage terminase large subunit-like protein